MDDETITTEPTPGSLIRDLLHAMGQPLTALQVCVLLRDHGMSPGSSCDDLLADMAEQVTSLTRLFSSLRTLLACGSPSAAITASDLRHSVHRHLARWQKEASARNVTLVVRGLALAESGTTKFWDVGPIHACLQDVFEAALLSSPSQGQLGLELLSDDDSGGLLLRVRGGDLLSEDSFSVRYGLPIAQVLLTPVAERCSYTTRSFEFTLKLLLPERMEAEDAASHPFAEDEVLKDFLR